MKIKLRLFKTFSIRHILRYSQIGLWVVFGLAFIYCTWFLYQRVYLTFVRPENPNISPDVVDLTAPIELKADKFYGIINELERKKKERPLPYVRNIF